MFNEEIMKKARLANSPEELIKLAEENGISLTKESANEYFNSLHTSGEVSDDELSAATGGCGGYDATIYKKCPRCGGKVPMHDYLNVKVIGPGRYYNGDLREFWRSYPTGVCENCQNRFAYIYNIDSCLPITQKGDTWTMYPEYELPN